MTKIMITPLLCLLTVTAYPQTIADLTRQLLIDKEQLALLKSTLQNMYNGYKDAKEGYTRIRDIAKDNFQLHQLFLDGLWVPSSAVRNDSQVTDILNIEYRIVT